MAKKHLKRQWTLFLVPFCHVDIGFSNTQDDVLKLHKLNLDGKTNKKGEKVGVLDLIDQTANYPENARFKFTSECSWPVYEFLNDASIPQERKEKLVHHMQKGDIEVCAFLISHTNKFMGPEMLVRSTTFACENLKQRYGISAQSAMLNDVGDASGIVPALTSAGVKYFFYGPNSLHYELPPLFYLKKPSGRDEKILMWITPGLSAYGENTDFGLRPPPPLLPFFQHNPHAALPDYETRIFQHLHWLENHGIPLEGAKKKKKWTGQHYDYPYDAYLIPYYPAHAGDNGHQDKTPCDIAKQWNEKHDNPKMKIATLNEFYRHVEEKHAAQIPSHRVDFTGFWGEQMFFSMNHIDSEKLVKIRKFEREAAGAEKFYSFLKFFKKELPPATETLLDAFKKAILMTDHNPCPVSFSGNKHPNNSSGISYTDNDVEKWKQTKLEWLKQLDDTAHSLQNSVLENLISCIKFNDDGARILVLNSLSWGRNGVVSIPFSPDASPFYIVREDTGECAPHQRISPSSLSFLAKNIPPHGYAVFKIVHGEHSQQTNNEKSTIAENPQGVEINNAHYALEIKSAGKNNEKLSVQITDKETKQAVFSRKNTENFLRPLFLMRRETLGSGIIFRMPRYIVKEEALKSLRILNIADGTVFTSVEFEGAFKEKTQLRTPFYLSLAAKVFSRMLDGKDNTQKINLPESIKITILLYHAIKRVDFICEITPVPLQIYELAFPLPMDAAVKEIHMDAGYQNINIPHDEAKAVPIKKSSISAYNFPFLWIQDYPYDNVFFHYAKFTGGKQNVYFSSRESGTLLFDDKTALKEGKVKDTPFYHLALGATFFGDLLVGSAHGNGAYNFSSMLTSSSPARDGASPQEVPEHTCYGYQYPLIAHVAQTKKNEKGILPLSFSFISLDKPNVMVTALKENGGGFLLRLYEFLGQNENVRVTLHANKNFSAFITTSSGEPLKEILADKQTSSFTILMEPHSFKTVKIQFHEGENNDNNDDEPFRNFSRCSDAAQ